MTRSIELAPIHFFVSTSSFHIFNLHTLIRAVEYFYNPDEEFTAAIDGTWRKLRRFLRVLHAVARTFSPTSGLTLELLDREVHTLTGLEWGRTIVPGWSAYPHKVTLFPSQLENKPSLPRHADDYVFRLSALFARQPAFSDTLVKTLALAREQADILSAYAQKAGHRGHLGDAFQGLKMR